VGKDQQSPPPHLDGALGDGKQASELLGQPASKWPLAKYRKPGLLLESLQVT